MKHKFNKKIQVCENYPFVVVGCIVEKNSKIVLVKEAETDKGKWNQPAGWLEKGENPIDAARRETKEETGLEVKITGFLGVYNLIFDNKKLGDLGITVKNFHPVKLIFSAKVIKDGKLENKKEIVEVKWFSKKQILAMGKRLRDLDIKDEVRDYFAGINYSLDIIKYRRIKS